MEKKHLISENNFALACAITLCLLYLVVTILMVAIPDTFVWLLSHIFHVKTGSPTIVELSAMSFLIGLFEVFIGSYFVALIFAWIYNMFVMTEVQNKPK